MARAWEIDYSPMSLARLHPAAQQARANQMAIDEKKRKLAMEPHRIAAVEQYQAGDPSQLQLIDPDLFGKLETVRLRGKTADIQQGQLDLSTKQMEAAGLAATNKAQAAEMKIETARKQQQVEILGRLVPGLAQQPDAVPAAIAHLQGHPAFKDEDLSWMQDPQSLEQAAKTLPAIAGTLENPEYPKLLQEYASAHGYQPGQLRQAQADPKVQADVMNALNARRKGAARGSGTNLTINPKTGEMTVPPTPSMQTAVQKEIHGNMKIIGALQRIKSVASPEQFTLKGRAAHALNRYIAHIDPDVLSKAGKGDLQARAAMLFESEQLFNMYRRKITGAQASVKEIAWLRKSMLNPDLSWPEFIVGMEQFYAATTRELRIGRRLLARGIPVGQMRDDDGAPAGALADMLASADAGRSAEDIRLRVMELAKSGVTDSAEVKRIMRMEGYDETMSFEDLMGE